MYISSPCSKAKKTDFSLVVYIATLTNCEDFWVLDFRPLETNMYTGNLRRKCLGCKINVFSN